jgi:hypothetical protein
VLLELVTPWRHSAAHPVLLRLAFMQPPVEWPDDGGQIDRLYV